jgi:hypothetical protein
MGAYAPSCLAQSNDSGATWRLFKSPMSASAERAGMIVFGPTAYLLHTWMDGSYYTGDSGTMWEKLGPSFSFEMYRAKDGYFYLGSDAEGTSRSLDGHVWTAVAGSPSCDPLVGDGNRVFCTTGRDANALYYAAKESDMTKWTEIPSPPPSAGSVHRTSHFAYDGDHHVLYASKTNDGLFRMVTQ